MVYVCYIKELSVEEILFCHPLPIRTTAGEIFEALNDFMQENHIVWSRCCGICTDGARAMTGRHSGLVKQVQAVAHGCCLEALYHPSPGLGDQEDAKRAAHGPGRGSKNCKPN